MAKSQIHNDAHKSFSYLKLLLSVYKLDAASPENKWENVTQIETKKI